MLKGKTTLQMTSAPEGSIYVWHTTDTTYATLLAVKLGRQDLKLVSPRWLMYFQFLTEKYPAIIVDHGLVLSETEMELLHKAKENIP